MFKILIILSYYDIKGLEGFAQNDSVYDRTERVCHNDYMTIPYKVVTNHETHYLSQLINLFILI